MNEYKKLYDEVKNQLNRFMKKCREQDKEIKTLKKRFKREIKDMTIIFCPYEKNCSAIKELKKTIKHLK